MARQTSIPGIRLLRATVALILTGVVFIVGAFISAAAGAPNAVSVALLILGPVMALAGFVAAALYARQEKQRRRSLGTR
jgi:positive regulator of sigma E activity